VVDLGKSKFLGKLQMLSIDDRGYKLVTMSDYYISC
jgi:hypothetical protein